MEEKMELQKEMQDLWELIKKYYHVQPDTNEEYWDAVIRDADLYHKKHPSARALDFITDFLRDLERRKPAC